MATERLRRELANDPSVYDPVYTALEHDPRFGEIRGYPPGSIFENRKACYDANVHTSLQAGISGAAYLGGFSIVVSGGYEDDCDNGNTLIYTGSGGRPEGTKYDTGPLVQDQTFVNRHNASLRKSCDLGKPVRVIRGPNPASKYAPAVGYRYDGLYKVNKAELVVGKSGHKICRFELSRIPGQMKVRVSKRVVIS
ncbi:PUA-like domain-containing protein [Cyathus striatus]|nr:PUA-like domain-containing protein [Cyathus striatus]